MCRNDTFLTTRVYVRDTNTRVYVRDTNTRVCTEVCHHPGMYGGLSPPGYGRGYTTRVWTGIHHPGMYQDYTILGIPGLYHPGYTSHPTMLYWRLLHRCKSPGEKPLGSRRENSLGESLSSC